MASLLSRARALIKSPGGRSLLLSPGDCCCGETPPNCTCANQAGCYEYDGPGAGLNGAKLIEGTIVATPPNGTLSYPVTRLIPGPCCCGEPIGNHSKVYRLRSYLMARFTNIGFPGGCPGGLMYVQETWIDAHWSFGNPIVGSRRVKITQSSLANGHGCGPFTTTDVTTTDDWTHGDGVGALSCDFGSDYLQRLGCGFGNATPPIQYLGWTETEIGLPSSATGFWRNSCSAQEGHATLIGNPFNGNPTERSDIIWWAYSDSDNADCTDPECRSSCCLPDFSCIDGLTAKQCRARGGVPQPPGFNCYFAGCDGSGVRPVGACCDPASGLCVMSSESECLSSGRVFKGIGSSCSPNPCAPPTGACCLPLPAGSCSTLTQAQCTQQGGAWSGAGSSCTPNPCAIPGGACCHPDGTCTQVAAAAACNGPGDQFQGVSTDCQAVSCAPQLGACCTPTSHGFDCAITTQLSCTAGTWVQGGVCPGSCVGGISTRPGAGAFL